MKSRFASAAVLLLVFVPVLLIGGDLFNFGVFVVSILGLREFINIKNEKKEIPAFIKFISYIMMSLLILANLQLKNMTFSIDYRILSALFMAYLIPTVLYHNREKYSVNDAFYMIGGVLFLGISMSLLLIIRDKSLALTAYLLLIAVITDTYAFITGTLIGRHKLLEVISPKKTWEGMLGGMFFGTFIGSIFYWLFVPNNMPVFAIVVMTLFLSVLGQYGDLVFSTIKRYFSKKDFSNIMPGHGGVLDRLDSIIFVLLGFIFFMVLV